MIISVTFTDEQIEEFKRADSESIGDDGAEDTTSTLVGGAVIEEKIQEKKKMTLYSANNIINSNILDAIYVSAQAGSASSSDHAITATGAR